MRNARKVHHHRRVACNRVEKSSAERAREWQQADMAKIKMKANLCTKTLIFFRLLPSFRGCITPAERLDDHRAQWYHFLFSFIDHNVVMEIRLVKMQMFWCFAEKMASEIAQALHQRDFHFLLSLLTQMWKEFSIVKKNNETIKISSLKKKKR